MYILQEICIKIFDVKEKKTSSLFQKQQKIMALRHTTDSFQQNKLKLKKQTNQEWLELNKVSISLPNMPDFGI